jgi:23S rRNA maturation mini-RNase III
MAGKGKKRMFVDLPEQDHEDFMAIIDGLGLKKSTLILAGMQCLAYQEYTRAVLVLEEGKGIEGLPKEEKERVKAKAQMHRKLWNNFFSDWVDNFKRGGEIHTAEAGGDE